MKKLLFFILFFSGILSSQTFAFLTYLQVNENISLYKDSTLKFLPQDSIASLTSDGAEFKMISSRKYKNNLAIEILANDKKNKGRLGWILLSDLNLCAISFYDENHQELEIVSINDPLFSIIHPENKNLALLPTTPIIFDPLIVWLEMIRNKVIVFDQTFPNDKIYFYRKIKESDNNIWIKIYSVDKSLPRLQFLPETLRRKVSEVGASLEPDFSAEDFTLHLNACSILKLNQNDYSSDFVWRQMMDCLDDIRKKLPSSSYENIIRSLFALPLEEREFLGMILTTYGESAGQPTEQMIGVMLTLKNRLNIAKQTAPSADMMDIALQAIYVNNNLVYQYSMWSNSNSVGNWKKPLSLVEEDRGEKDVFIQIMKSYIRFNSPNFSVEACTNNNGKNIDPSKIINYATCTILNPKKWYNSSDSLTLKIPIENEVKSIGTKQDQSAKKGHTFFQISDVGYKFFFHPWSPKH